MIKMSANTVTTVTTANPLRVQYQVKSFYAKGLYWLFYDGGDGRVYYVTSKEGVNWSSGILVRVANAEQFSVVHDGSNYIHYGYGGGAPLYYRRGLLASDGTITWDAEQTVVPCGVGDGTGYPIIILDSEGCPWIGYQFGEVGPTYKPYVVKSSTKDGTWTTDAGFPYKLSDITGTFVIAVPLALSNNKVYVLYSNHGDKVYGQLYDAGWSAEETASTNNVDMAPLVAVVDSNDNIHLIIRIRLVGLNRRLVYLQRSYTASSWSPEESLQDFGFDVLHDLSIDLQTGRLYAFWGNTDSIELLKRLGGVWDSTPTKWITGEGSFPSVTEGPNLTSFTSKLNHRIGVAWVRGAGTPYDIRYAVFVLLDANLKNTKAL